MIPPSLLRKKRDFMESMLTSNKRLEDFIYLNKKKTEILNPDWLKKGQYLSLSVYLFSPYPFSLNNQKKPIQSVNDKLRNDIMNYNNWLTKMTELKQEIKTATSDIIKIISEFTFLFWLDNFEHINENQIQFGETFHEQIENLSDELKNIWDSEYYSQHFESTLNNKICSDSVNFIEGLENYVKIEDQGQTGSSSFNLSRSLTSTSTPKDVQMNTNLQTKQKSTIIQINS